MGWGDEFFLTQRFAKVNAEVRKEDLRWGGEVLIFNMPFVGFGKYKYCVKNSTDMSGSKTNGNWYAKDYRNPSGS